MTSKERFLKALFANPEEEELVNFKLFPGSNRDAQSDDVYNALADVIVKDRIGLLAEIDLAEMEKNLPKITLEAIKGI